MLDQHSHSLTKRGLIRRTPTPAYSGDDTSELYSPDSHSLASRYKRVNDVEPGPGSWVATSSQGQCHSKINIRSSPLKHPAAPARRSRHPTTASSSSSSWLHTLLLSMIIAGCTCFIVLMVQAALSMSDSSSLESTITLYRSAQKLRGSMRSSAQHHHHLSSRLADTRTTLEVPTFFQQAAHHPHAGFQTLSGRHHHGKMSDAELQQLLVQQALMSSADLQVRALGAHPPKVSLPDDFHWQTYIKLWPDLKQAISTQRDAEDHYVSNGALEHRVYRDYPLAVRYTSCSGLINQHYSHLAGIALAMALQADTVIVPPALARDSFKSYFSTFAEKNEVNWTAAAFDTVWDQAYLSEALTGRTPPMIVTTTPEDAPLPNLLTPEAAYATSLPASISIWDQVVRFGRVYLQNRTMDDLVAAARLAASQAASKLDNNGSQPILLDLPCTMFAIKAASAPDIMLQATKALRFAPAIIRLAEKVVAGMGSSMLPADRTSATTSASTAASFNGLHLRLEQDAKDWTRTLGGTEVLITKYLDSCQQAGFDPQTPLYLASGLCTYGDRKSLLNVTHQLASYSSSIHYKEQYLSKAEMDELTSEQTALVDFLVLARARSFVGISVSTFSHFLREYRALAGLPRSSSVLVDASDIGTDDLFADAGTVVGEASAQEK